MVSWFRYFINYSLNTLKLQCRHFDLNVSSIPAAMPLGVITVPGDSDLETCRLLIERLHDDLDQVIRDIDR